MQDTAGGARKNLKVTFSHGPLHMYVPVLADQQELTNISVDTRCSLKDLPRVINNRDGW